ncbi:MAG: hypothetical protein HQK53_13415 [Oligoflexia bacterium]|nr:hypothetical protein [Oligoflexia bacterium]
MKLSISFLLLICLTISSALASNAHELKIKMTMPNKEAFTANLVVKGQTASIIDERENEKIFIDVTKIRDIDSTDKVSQKKYHQIYTEFIISKLDKKGKKVVISNPQTLAIENEEATFEDGKGAITLSVIPSRKEI